MYIVAIGWAYVILMVAITSGSVTKAIAILVFLGVIPIGLFAYVFGRPRRRSVPVQEVADERDTSDTKSNQD